MKTIGYIALSLWLAQWAVAVEFPSAVSQPTDALNIQPRILDSVGFDQRLGEKVADAVPFKTEDGKDITIGDFLHKTPIVLGMVYYGCPKLCNLTIRGLFTGLQNLSLKLGKDFQVVLVSIDPTETSGYAKMQKEGFLKSVPVAGGETGIHFLTGKEANIRQLADSIGFRYRYDEARQEYAHGAGVVVLSPNGALSHYLFGVDFPARDLKLSLVEASKGQVGSVVDKFLLFCYHYDPLVGKYGFFIMNIVRVSAVLFVFAILGALVFWGRAHRKKVLQVS